MFPVALEDQYSAYFVRSFDAHASFLAKNILDRIKDRVQENDDSRLRRAQQDSAARHDDDLLTYIESLRDKYGDVIPASKMEANIRRNMHLVDAWSESLVKRSLVPIQKKFPTVSPFPGRSERNESLYQETIKENLKLIQDLKGEQFNQVQSVVSEGIRTGKSYKEIANSIQGVTSINRNRAEFWARDQLGTYFGKNSELRQTEAGISGYIWRTLKDHKVRDGHAHLEGTFHYWSKPPVVSARYGRRRHPGRDYRCRCWAEPTVGPEQAERDYVEPRIGEAESKFPEIAESRKIGVRDFSGNEEIKKEVNYAVSVFEKKFEVSWRSLGFSPEIKIRNLKDSRNYLVGSSFDPIATKIEINPLSSTVATDVIHEKGHMVDFLILGRGGDYGSKGLDKLHKIMLKSKAMQRLQNWLNTPGWKRDEFEEAGKMVVRSVKSVGSYDIFYDDLIYWLRHEEMFARAFEQFVSTVIKDKFLIQRFNLRKSMIMDKLGYDAYWTKREFVAILKEFEALFINAGILK